jgi:hypothetical protein
LPDAQAIAQRLGVNPLEILLHFASNNWEALGYDSADKRVATQDGTVLVDRIETGERIAAASKACDYLYARRKSVELTDADGNNPFQTFNDWVKTIASKVA